MLAKFDWLDVTVPLVVPLFTTFLGWSFMRTVHGGTPIARLDKYLLLYGYFFLAGASLLMLVGGGELGWPQPLWVFLVMVWAALLVQIARAQYRRSDDTNSDSSSLRNANSLAQGAIPVPAAIVILRVLVGFAAIGAITRPNPSVLAALFGFTVLLFISEKRRKAGRAI